MTTMTWTASAPTATTPALAATGLRVLRRVGQFIAICAGAYAEQDSAYRGLDLNGNPVWAR